MMGCIFELINYIIIASNFSERASGTMKHASYIVGHAFRSDRYACAF